MVMTLQLTRMVVMMAKPNMGWVKTVRAILLIGWKGERIHIALVAENLAMKYMMHNTNVQQIIRVKFGVKIVLCWNTLSYHWSNRSQQCTLISLPLC